MGGRVATISAFAILIFFACSGNAENGSLHATRFDLKAYGWAAPEPAHFDEFDPQGPADLISIDHQNRIAVGFTTRASNALVTREHPALSFNVVRFDARGSADLSVKFPTNNWRRNSLYLTPQDSVVVRSNDGFYFVDSISSGQKDLDENSEKLPCEVGCHILQSPSRRTLLLLSAGPNGVERELDLSGTPSSKVCKAAPRPTATITDTRSYFIRSGFVPGALQQKFDLESWPLCDGDSVSSVSVCIGGRISALNSGKAAIRGTHAVAIVGYDGRCESIFKLGKHEGAGTIRTDEDGDRFAVEISEYGGGNKAFDISGHRIARRIVVFNTDNGKQLATFSIAPIQKYFFDFTLDANGHRLAILIDNIVEVFNLE